jgi:hypothetical protein
VYAFVVPGGTLNPSGRWLERGNLTSGRVVVVVRGGGSITLSARVKMAEKCVYVRVGS